MLTVEGLSKTYAATEALRSVSFHIDQGEFVSIIGPTGCGKSTLLEIIAGLQEASSGSVQVAGEPLRGPRRATSVIFQEASILPWRTVLGNVEFALEMDGVRKGERRQKAHDMIRLVGLSGFERHWPAQLSGGMKQRVAIARCLTTGPDLLLADEPFGALDEQTRLVLAFELLRIVGHSGATVLFVTHSIQEAVLLSDRVLVMGARPGTIVEEVHIPLPSPRTAELLGSEALPTFIDRIWSVLRVEAMRAMSAPPSVLT